MKLTQFLVWFFMKHTNVNRSLILQPRVPSILRAYMQKLVSVRKGNLENTDLAVTGRVGFIGRGRITKHLRKVRKLCHPAPHHT